MIYTRHAEPVLATALILFWAAIIAAAIFN